MDPRQHKPTTDLYTYDFQGNLYGLKDLKDLQRNASGSTKTIGRVLSQELQALTGLEHLTALKDNHDQGYGPGQVLYLFKGRAEGRACFRLDQKHMVESSALEGP